MAIQFQTYNTATASSTTVAVTKPSGLAIGDLMVAHFHTDIGTADAITLTPPTGFIYINGSEGVASGDRAKASAYYKIADASDVAAVDFTFTSSQSARLIASVSRWTGATRIDQSNAGYNSGSSTVSAGSIDPSVNSSYFIFMGSVNSALTFSGYAAVTDNPTWTEVYDVTNVSQAFCMAYGSRPQDTDSGAVTAISSSGSSAFGRIGIVFNIYDLPVVTSDSTSNIGINSATATGTVTDDGGSVVLERGFVYSTSVSPTTADSKAVSSGTTGTYSVSIQGLTANTTYYTRAFVRNSNGTSYGAELSFTTLAAPANTMYFDFDGVEGQEYAFRMYIGGTTGTVTVTLGTTGSTATFNAGSGYNVLQGSYGGINGLIIEASGTFDGYIDDVFHVLIVGDGAIDWVLDTLTTIFPINSSVVFRRLEDKDFNQFRVYRYLDIQFKDFDAYVTVLLKKEANESGEDNSKEFLVSNTSEAVLPFINKKLSMLTKNQAIRIGVSNNRLSETFTVCQLIIKGFDQSSRTFDGGKIINIT